MTILVDTLFFRDYVKKSYNHTLVCHAASDQPDQRGLLELYELAHALEVDDRSVHWGGPNKALPHLDLTKKKRALALRLGAVEVDTRELIRRCRWSAAAMQLGGR